MLTEKLFDTGELTLNYAEGPASGPPILLLHGLTGWWHSWDTEILELVRSWHVYALDLRGHGKSGRINTQYRVIDYVPDVIAFLRYIGESVVLMGHSLGALTALVTAAEYPEGVRAAVLVDPALFLRNTSINVMPWAKDWFTWVDNMVKDSPSYEVVFARCRSFVPPETSEIEVKALTDQICGVAAGTVENVLRDEHLDGFDLARVLQSITSPTLLVQGDWANGGVIRQEDAEFFRANLPGAAIDFIPNGSHVFPGEYADTILRHMNAFLQSV